MNDKKTSTHNVCTKFLAVILIYLSKVPFPATKETIRFVHIERSEVQKRL